MNERRDPMEADSINITVPAADGDHVPVREEAENACAGDATFRGNVYRTGGWTLADVKVLVRPGWNIVIPRSDTQQNGESALTDPATNQWSINSYPTVRCTGGSCTWDGKSTIAVEALWEMEGPEAGPPLQDWEAGAATKEFIGDCVAASAMRMAIAESLTNRTSRAMRIDPDCSWHFYPLDINARGHGTKLELRLDTPLRASVIACYAAGVDWEPNGIFGKTIRSPQGNWKMPVASPAHPDTFSAPFANIFEGSMMVFQPAWSVVPADRNHAALVQVVDSISRCQPTILNLDDRLDVWVQLNVFPSVRWPHTGTAGIWVKRLA